MKKLLCLVVSVTLLCGLDCALASEETGYDFIEGFSEGLAAARQNNMWGFINEEGETVVPFIYREVSAFSEGLAAVRADSHYGYIDKNGNVVIPMLYTSAEPFNEGLAIVHSEGKAGAINKLGETVVPFEYDYISNFSEGYAVVEKDGLYNFAGKDGRLLFSSAKLQYAMPFGSGVAFVRNARGEQYFINGSGSQVFRTSSEVFEPFAEGYAIAAKGGKYFIMSTNGLNVTYSLYDMAEDGEDGFIYLTSGSRSGFFDKSTKKVTISSYYEMISPPSEGLMLAVKDGMYGFVDDKLTVVLPLKYAYAESFREGLALAVRSELYGFIDKSGKTAIPFKFEEAESFNEGLSIVRTGKYYGCIDREGNFVIPAEYSYIQGFKDGVSVARKNGRYVVLHNPLTYNKKVLAIPSVAVLVVDGAKIDIEAFSIGGSNYFKLRDIAYILKDSIKRFNILYNESSGSFTLKPNEPYTPNGNEMTFTGISYPFRATASEVTVYFDNQEYILTSYKIGDSYFYKLRDIARLVGFSVEWDADRRAISVDTAKQYSAE